MSVFAALDEERVLLGTSLLYGARVVDDLQDRGLLPEHFLEPVTRRVWTTILDVRSRSNEVDTASVAAHFQTNDEKVYVDHLTAEALTRPETLGELVDVLKRTHLRRTWQDASTALMQAADTGDEKHVETAERLLRADTDQADEEWDARRLIEDAFDWITDDQPYGMPTGFPDIDEAIHGLRPGDVTALGGHSKMGKSLVCDQMLTAAVQAGFRAHLFINEMSPRDRALRLLAQQGVAPHHRLATKKLTGDELERMTRAKLPFGITDVSAWPVERMCRAIRSRRWDLVALDVLQNIPFKDTRDLDLMLSLLLSACRSSGTHLILVSHLNDARAMGPVLPRPVMRDFRNSGMIVRVAAAIIALHRDQSNEGGFVSMSLDASLEVLASRHGANDGAALRLDVESLRFVSLEPPRAVAA